MTVATSSPRLTRRDAIISLVPEYVSGGSVLEIGCATGERLASLRAQGWQDLHGIELVPAAAQLARDEGFDIKCATAEAGLEQYPDGTFDVVVASMVLEHLTNPFTVVRRIAAKLKPGGQFLFSTIIRDSLDRAIYGRYWAGFDFPRHMVHFRRSDILEMLQNDFHGVSYEHQVAPIDYVRSSSWRRTDGALGIFDRVVLRLGTGRMATALNTILARAGKTCRISFRCRKI